MTLPLLILVSVVLSGCLSTPTVYQGNGVDGLPLLGDVTVCAGSFCKKPDGGYESVLSLPAPPPAYSYEAALRKKAASVFGVPEQQIAIGDMQVAYYAEFIGTIRGWVATAMTARRATPTATANDPHLNNLASPYYSR
jgi:hypothetical protein